MKPEEKIFEYYMKSKEDKLYFNQIKEYTNLSNSSLQNSLNKLIKNKAIIVEKTKSNTYYKINDKKLFALEFSKIAFNLFKNLNKGVRIPLEELLKNLNIEVFTIILFGSSSKKQETKDSDIDLLIVSDKNIKKIDDIKKKAELISNYPINIFSCNIDDLKNSKDHLIVQAKTTGFPIKGEQNFYEVLLNEL